MRVFLTGSTGFIGSHLREFLVAKGYEVICHSLSRNGRLTDIPHSVDVVVNCAGKLGGQGTTPDELAEANLHLPVRLCQLSLKSGSHFIHLSTPGVTGLRANGSENDAYAPCGQYEKTKAEAEQHIIKHMPEAVILRPDFVFGEGDLHKLALFRQIAKGWFPLVGSGSALTRPTSVHDVTRAVHASFPDGILGAGIYNIAGPDIVSMRDLVKIIATVMGIRVIQVPLPVILLRCLLHTGPLKPSSLSASRIRLFGTDRFTSISKAVEAGFNPERTFKEIAESAVKWYRERGLL